MIDIAPTPAEKSAHPGGRRPGSRRAAALLVLLAVCLALLGCRGSAGGPSAPTALPAEKYAAQRTRPLPMPAPVRAVWIARFHLAWRSPEQVREMIGRAADLGFNTVLWQVRGEGTVLYPSQIEPWSREYGHRDPGFDPLAVAVDEAHRRGMRIEAWFNVMPGWKGPQPPPIREQLYYSRPAWFLYDGAGRRQPLGDFYVILNPCLPEVRQHVARVADEILRHYDVDGLHLDYVRFALDTEKGAEKRYPRDERTVELFHRETGRTPDDDPAAWDAWRTNQITRIVADLRRLVDTRRPGATLTAAVKSTPREALRNFQYAAGWLNTGLLDAVYPMIYTTDLRRFTSDVAAYRRAVGDRRVIPGVGIYMHTGAEQMRAQLSACRGWNGDFALFSYESLLPTAQEAGRPADRRSEQQREMRRGVLSQFR